MIAANSGPNITTGNTNPVQNTEPDQGPSLTFQGGGLLDPRFVSQIGGPPGTKIYGLYSNSYVVSTDAVPVTAGAARIAAAAAPAAAVAIPLVTAQAAGVAPLIPLLPFGLAPISTNLVQALALDFGFTVGSVTAASKVMTIPVGAWRYFALNQRIIVAGGGASGGNLFTTVAAAVVPGTTTITLNDAAGGTNAAVAIGAAHPTLNAAWPFLSAGTIALFDPTQGICRAVSLTANVGATGQVVTVRGYDTYGQAMSESITVVGGSTVNGKKAFKYIASVTPATTDAGHTISAGTTDVLGINFRSDYWEYMDIFMAGQFVTTNTGWTVADITGPSSVTGDVRGTYALQTPSNGDGSVANWATSRRLAIFSSLPIFNTVNANNLNYATMYGNTQA